MIKNTLRQLLVCFRALGNIEQFHKLLKHAITPFAAFEELRLFATQGVHSIFALNDTLVHGIVNNGRKTLA